ncbi:ROK family protein [Sphaerisporangium sp. NPDC051011]|uniref:ROK family transcriptional regulator n=1 Tax=Sphaerisporangium sp. NPDC051011 TaxID=3155792 RepID=UPI0033E5E35F
MPRRHPGTPRLLRQLNDRAALELLLSKGPLTRAELGEYTGLSKVTSGQLLARLEDRGLVAVSGERPGGRGPNAALYAVVPSSAYVVGLEVLPESVTAGVADITGEIIAEVTVDPEESGEPAKTVHNAVRRVCDSANVSLSRLRALVIGTRGVVDPRTGDVRFSFDLPSWHAGVLDDLRATFGSSVMIENDVNLAALAEHAYGVARGVDDFVLVWAGVGQGLGVMLGSRLHRGFTGGAGEIGWLPVPGEPLPIDVNEPQSGSFQRLVGTAAVTELATTHGLPTAQDVPATQDGSATQDISAAQGVPVTQDGSATQDASAAQGVSDSQRVSATHGRPAAHGLAAAQDVPGAPALSGSHDVPEVPGLPAVPALAVSHEVPDEVPDLPGTHPPRRAAQSSAELVSAAVAAGQEDFLDELARRLAIGVAAVTVVLDPGLVVLSGDVGRAGGRALAGRIEKAVAEICPSRPRVTVTEVKGNPVLRGAVTAALEQAREEVFSSTVDT